MDSMMAMILELSQKVHGQDKAAAEQTGIHLTRLSWPQHGRKSAKQQDSPARDLDLDELVNQRVEQR